MSHIFYIAPPNKTVHNCKLQLDKDFIKSRNVEYLAFYSTVPSQQKIDTILEYCSESSLINVHGYNIGFTCKVDRSRLP